MSFRSNLERLLVLSALLVMGVLPAFAAPVSVLPFGRDSWQALTRQPTRAKVVVFSTTECVHCPKVIAAVAASIRQAQSATPLAVVVMDGAGHEDDVRRDAHHRNANALYVFDGDEQALRYGVNPDWRGLTPYVALVPANGPVSFHSGTPPVDALRRFLATDLHSGAAKRNKTETATR